MEKNEINSIIFNTFKQKVLKGIIEDNGICTASDEYCDLCKSLFKELHDECQRGVIAYETFEEATEQLLKLAQKYLIGDQVKTWKKLKKRK